MWYWQPINHEIKDPPVDQDTVEYAIFKQKDKFIIIPKGTPVPDNT